MRIDVPVNVKVNNTMQGDWISHPWKVTLTISFWFAVAALIVSLVFAGDEYGRAAALVGGVEIVATILVLVFGIGAIKEQPTALAKFGGLVLLLALIAVLVYGGWLLQGMLTPVSSAVMEQTIPAPLVTIQPQSTQATNSVPPKIEVEHSVHGSVSVQVRDTTPVVAETPPQEIPPPEDLCDPGGEKARAWGWR